MWGAWPPSSCGGLVALPLPWLTTGHTFLHAAINTCCACWWRGWQWFQLPVLHTYCQRWCPHTWKQTLDVWGLSSPLQSVELRSSSTVVDCTALFKLLPTQTMSRVSTPPGAQPHEATTGQPVHGPVWILSIELS